MKFLTEAMVKKTTIIVISIILLGALCIITPKTINTVEVLNDA